MDSTIELPSIGCDPATPGKVSNVNTETDPMIQEVEALIPTWFTLDDAARELGIEVNRVRQLLAEGSLVSVRRGERSLTSIPAPFFSGGEGARHAAHRATGSGQNHSSAAVPVALPCAGEDHHHLS